jgi:ABC-2 type transport system permease protein
MARTFLGALRHESIRLRSVRSTWVLLLGALVAAGLVAFVVARDITSGGQSLSDPEAVVSLLTGSAGVGPLSFTALFAGIVGVLALGQEYRHGLMQTTLTAIPRRRTLLLAKLVVVALFSAVTAGLSIAVAYTVGRIEIGSAFDLSLVGDGSTPRALGGFLALVVLTSLFGVALAGIVRSIPVAAVILIGLPLLVEPVLIWALSDDGLGAGNIAAYLPFTAGAQMVNLPGGDGPGYDLVVLSAVTGGLTFLAFVAVTTLLSSAVFARRDA